MIKKDILDKLQLGEIVLIWDLRRRKGRARLVPAVLSWRSHHFLAFQICDNGNIVMMKETGSWKNGYWQVDLEWLENNPIPQGHDFY